MFGMWKETGRAGTCAFLFIPMLKNNRQVPINCRAELATLWVTPVAVWAGLSVAVPGLPPFTPEAPQGHPGATTGASDETDAGLPFQREDKKKEVWNSNRHLPCHVHFSIIHNSKTVETTQVSISG